MLIEAHDDMIADVAWMDRAGDVTEPIGARPSAVSMPFADLPTFTACFEAVGDERADTVLRAIGRLVWGANLLETVLLLIVLQLLDERDGQIPSGEELAYLEKTSAGRRLGLLRDLDIPADLEARIDAVLKRRNDIVHHTLENPEIVRAVLSGVGIELAVEEIDQVALDCGKIGGELFAVAGPILEAKVGKTPNELVEMLAAIDLESIEDPQFRKQLEVVQAIRGVDLTLPWQAMSDEQTDDQGQPRETNNEES